MSATALRRQTLTITRVIDAPRALVFRAWTDAALAARWWGPRGFTATECRIDARVGGAYRTVMRSPDGTEHRQRGVCRDVIPPERLVFTFAWEDAQGGLGPETLVTVTLAEEGGKTRLTLRHEGFETSTARDGHQEGWGSALERLAEAVADAS